MIQRAAKIIALLLRQQFLQQFLIISLLLLSSNVFQICNSQDEPPNNNNNSNNNITAKSFDDKDIFADPDVEITQFGLVDCPVNDQSILAVAAIVNLHQVDLSKWDTKVQFTVDSIHDSVMCQIDLITFESIHSSPVQHTCSVYSYSRQRFNFTVIMQTYAEYSFSGFHIRARVPSYQKKPQLYVNSKHVAIYPQVYHSIKERLYINNQQRFLNDSSQRLFMDLANLQSIEYCVIGLNAPFTVGLTLWRNVTELPFVTQTNQSCLKILTGREKLFQDGQIARFQYIEYEGCHRKGYRDFNVLEVGNKLPWPLILLYLAMSIYFPVICPMLVFVSSRTSPQLTISTYSIIRYRIHQHPVLGTTMKPNQVRNAQLQNM